MTKTYRELRKEGRLGYYGILAWMHIAEKDYNKKLPKWLWKLYWKFQPIRCLFGWHNWYDILAGEAISCTCWRHPFKGYPHRIYMQYRFRPWLMKWASALDDANHRAELWYEWYMEEIRKRV